MTRTHRMMLLHALHLVVPASLFFFGAPWLATLLGVHDEVARQAVTYLRSSAPGLPGMLTVLAATIRLPAGNLPRG